MYVGYMSLLVTTFKHYTKVDLVKLCLLAGVAVTDAARALYSSAAKIVKQRLSNPQELNMEFYHIEVLDDDIQHPYQVATANSMRNRYSNVLPYDYNRYTSCWATSLCTDLVIAQCTAWVFQT